MFRIDHPTAAAALPAPSAAGTPGYFQGGDPASGTPRTVVTQDWANLVQEELCTVALAAGAPLSKTDTGQVLKGIKATVTGMFGQSLSAQGYVKLPSGLIVQWGDQVALTGNGDLFAFPIAFPNAVLSGVLGEANPLGWISSNGSGGNTLQPTVWGFKAVSLTQYAAYTVRYVAGQNYWAFGGPAGFYLLAVGY